MDGGGGGLMWRVGAYLLTGIDGRWWGRVDVEGGNLSAYRD